MSLKYGLFLAFLLNLLACDKEIENYQYPFTSLNKLVVDNDISVRLIQDSANYIDISGPAFVVKNIVPKFSGDTILLSNPTIIGSYDEAIWADIHFTDFRTLFLRNGGDVINEEILQFSAFGISSNKAMGHVSLSLNCESLGISISTGSVSLDLSGSAEYARVWTTAPGFIDMQNFDAKSVKCINNSSNDCYVRASQELDADAQYFGRIFYHGDPEILIIPPGQEEKVIQLSN